MTRLVVKRLRSVSEVAAYLHPSEQSVYGRTRSWWREETTLGFAVNLIIDTAAGWYAWRFLVEHGAGIVATLLDAVD